MSQEINSKASGTEMSPSEPAADELLIKAALDYHRFPTPGKITVLPTKDMTTQRDLALAYSPGVAAACHWRSRRPARGREPDIAREPGRRDLQWHGRAGLGQYRCARR